MDDPKQRRSVFGLLVFIATEVMFFAGLLSAYWVLRSQIQPWPPIDQPRYPIPLTALNTIILLLSGWAFWHAEKLLQGSKKVFRTYLLLAGLGGALFLAIQGWEWARLIQYGMNAASNVYGGIFYLIVGSHAFHILIALMVLILLLFQAFRGKYTAENHTGIRLGRIYWLFVVLLWPVIYVALYLL